ncbi:MAG: hypothetical protein ABF461_04850 [Zymomonas mobilis subsp. pomaceae]|uniref:Uncharacterized protein n=1 Tax=Zymomonas mobilis subsp. pomaceae (strain ATCC 29192 / DSM 22645 / JCM 10191 / CCUG 17912 / NBRC 13757 / NCIMB 11200 / NRRL B-4491 / Barker I) TaxID=579138 RepID=F8EV71_ZYMMT|nr:hypothetical protein [Zymomonas mobilis]AEI38289.1 hypothetical protein Zymop_1399 [Zymomonas mobilis subsp. pomaceae ATCC 29192]MDX5947977.1 hypothetical protein [Zymomonas mobilis subsp. pomaceae]GEB89307.1 hypothetical protein ZMO02_09440 [Zymomonas mobilis subsp. pomaceae]
MKWIKTAFILIALNIFSTVNVQAQPLNNTENVQKNDFTYADFVDLILASPIVASVDIVRATKLSQKLTPDLPEGESRFFVEAKVVTLIRGAEGLANDITYLVDTKDDERGHPQRIKEKTQYLIFGQPVAGHPEQVVLTRPYANLIWTENDEATAASITRDILSNTPAPQITAITGAFYVPGSLPGESESQIFLQTASRQPISLNILRRPQEKPQWAVALGEMTDEEATPPAPHSFLWYRLACGLPKAMPQAVLSTLSGHDMLAVAEDYKVVLGGLGPCLRNHHL